MSCSLSQKIDADTPYFHRFFMAYGVTDEIFGVSMSREGRLNPFYYYGLVFISALGWVGGTFLGVMSGNLLPARIVSALSITLYGMFIAIIIPPARDNKVVAGIILCSMALGLLFAAAPFLREISSGFRIIILTVIISGGAALLFPISDSKDDTE